MALVATTTVTQVLSVRKWIAPGGFFERSMVFIIIAHKRKGEKS
jgi:hypothetical protein